MTRHDPSRRQVLLAGAAAGALGLSARRASAWPREERRTKRVVLVAFAGGVRTKETFGAPENVPNMAAMAEEGVLFPRMRTSNLGHFGATMSIFTGISEARGIRENARGEDPTLFEYLRKDGGLAAGDVWIATTGGAQQTNYAYSLHSEYGAKFGANTLDGDGIFNREFQRVLAAYGRPKELEPAERALLERMRGSMGAGEASGAAAREAAENAARVEEYILNELTRGTADLRGANAGDAKALRVARNLVALFRPRVTAVVLQNADVAHGSYNAYAEVIRRNDAMIGELWTAVRSDPELADSTAFFVLPEFGRDSDLNERRGLDHGDGSDDLRYVAGLAWGPDFHRGREVAEEVRTIDVLPTVCDLFGVTPGLARGKKLRGLLS